VYTYKYMVLVLHILIALGSVGYTTYVFFAPSAAKLRASYALVALTILSGTYLAVSNPAHILQTCVSGLIYTGAVSVGIAFARKKLATAKNRQYK
jgi:hypothetical protein